MVININLGLTLRKIYSLPTRVVFLFSFLFTFGSNYTNAQFYSKKSLNESEEKKTKILFFSPEIAPDVEEIKQATMESYFGAVTDFEVHQNKISELLVKNAPQFEKADTESIKTFCANNDVRYAVLSHIQFFKVGIGQFVFSSQVVVRMKLYDAQGNIISERSYDTLKKNARIFGSAENFIKIGTTGALKYITKDLKKHLRKFDL